MFKCISCFLFIFVLLLNIFSKRYLWQYGRKTISTENVFSASYHPYKCYISHLFWKETHVATNHKVKLFARIYALSSKNDIATETELHVLIVIFSSDQAVLHTSHFNNFKVKSNTCHASCYTQNRLSNAKTSSFSDSIIQPGRHNISPWRYYWRGDSRSFSCGLIPTNDPSVADAFPLSQPRENNQKLDLKKRWC